MYLSLVKKYLFKTFDLVKFLASKNQGEKKKITIQPQYNIYYGAVQHPDEKKHGHDGGKKKLSASFCTCIYNYNETNRDCKFDLTRHFFFLLIFCML